MKSILQIAVIVALALVTSCAVLCIAVWAASPFAPEQGLVLLKNGQVIEGGVLREGDRYVITLGRAGEKGELKLPVQEVDAVCRSLEDAYRHKQRQIVHRSAKPHLELAEWCLRNGLTDRAADELVAAMAIDPHEPKIAALERRMKLAAEPKADKPHAAFALPTTDADMEGVLRTLPSNAVESFATDVQPLLLSRCATTACHGPGATSSYRLIRPPLKHANKTRETQRNLFATLAQIAPEGESPVLTKPLAPHGGLSAPVLSEQDRRQIELLATWVESVRMPGKRTTQRPATVNDVRPASFEEDIKPSTSPSIKRLPGVEEPRAFSPEASAKPLTPPKTAPVKDPFDPAQFNQKYHSK